MSHHLPNLLVVVAMLAGLLVPTVTVGATPVVSAPSPQEGVEVHVPNFVFDPLLGSEPKLSDAQRVDSQEAGLRLVQFSGPTRDAWLAGLEAAGLRVLQYYPDYTYLVWGEQSALSTASSLEFVRWTGDFQPAYKVNSDLVGREGLVQNVAVLFYNDGNIEGTLDALQVMGANVIQAHPAQPDAAFYEAIVALDAAAFDAVSRLGTVVWLGYSHPVPVLDDEMSDQILAGNYSISGVPFTGYETHLAGLGVNGAGVRWATIDTGVDYDHPDLGPHIVAGYDFPGACSFPGQPGSDCASGGHGTHVTGIIGGSAAGGFADANGFKYGLGMAPAYDIVAMNSLSASAWPPAGGWQEHSKRAVLMSAVGGNNSWTTGEGTAHGYQASERTHDLMVLDGNFDTTAVEPFIEVFSAGNSGPSAYTLTAPKEAKNLIIVASSINYRAGSIDSISSFSSRGPAVDGRIVPTITTPGEQIASSRNDLGGDCATAIAGTNNLYAFCSGTSMASPHASGAVVLATQWWRGFNAGANPSPAMAKALLVNSAIDMGTADIPNFNEGWGRINITKMIQPDVLVEYWDQEHVFTESGQQWTISVGVQNPTKPLKVTLAWADAAGAAGANPALVNNLNLTVTNGANTYKGNVFSGGWSATGGSADALNNLENVYVQNPAGGATIVIDAVNIAGDAVLGNADPTDQGFALICQNCALFPDYTLAATPSGMDVCAPANAAYNVAVGSILGYADPVVLSVSGNPAGTTAGFAPNPVTPPGASTLTIGNTGAAAAGSYNLTVTGASTSGSKSVDVGLNLFTAAPAVATLVSPADGALNVPAVPTFTWSAVAQAATYSIEVATDAGFTNIVATASGLTGTTWTSNVALNTSTTHYWRVQATNACGVGAYSAVFSFITVAAPGDCGPGTVPNVLYQYGFEAGAAGWTSSGTGNTWALSTVNPHSGMSHFRGLDPATISDQRLASPPVALPTDQDPVVLKFWHLPNMEGSSTSCYDGGILEVSADAGATWTQVSNANLLVGPYTGAISGSFSNPLAGLQGWCGASAYFNTIANLSAYAGQTVQFRYRLGSDTSVGDVGWDVDDVMVQSCEPSGSYAAISLVKTVGTTAGVCAATSNITVAPGATVYYCYTVTNTGTVTLNLHTLNDDVLGTIFSGLNYALAPGASVNTVAAGLSIPYVANVTTTNTATWTAYETGGPSATANASATVTVVVPDPNINVDPLSLDSTQPVNTTTSQTLTVGNTGGSDLVWSIAEELPAAVVPASPAQLPAAPQDPQAALEAELSGAEAAAPAVLPQRDPAAHANAVRMMFTTGVLLVPDSTNDRVMALDPTTGDVVDADFIPSNSVMGTAVNAILGADGESILVSDQVNDVVHKFDLDGNYLGVFAPAGGANTAILNNVRGISLDASGNLLVTTADAANNDAVAKFDTAGNYLGNFVANGAGGLDSPFDIYGRTADWLSGGSSSSAIHRYDLTGAYIANLATISTFPEQIAEAANSNVLVANFSPTSNEGVIELTPDGALVGRYDPTGLTGYRGAYELPGGTILTTTGTGVHEIDRSGNLVESKITGVSGRFIEYVAPPTICTNPADVPWLSEAPTAGTTAAGGSTAVQVTFDSTGLAVGAYTANLCVASNDPDPGPGNGTELVVVPVTLNVTEAPAASISLVKTVGTTPGVCATTDSITVNQGTEVYYCYQAENTGSVTFNFHDLEDTELGTLLADFPYTLAPGASSPEVIVPDTPMATVTNVATWTAFTSLAGYAADINAPYSYIPINATGAALGLTDDGEANITLPFDFTFFGVTSNALRVGNNGGILFNVTTGDLSTANGALPAATPALAILPFWDDIDSDTGEVYWEVQGTAPNRMAIIEWYNRPHFSNTGAATFEVLLYEGTNELKFQYADVDFGNTSYNNGASATVGINKDATTALQVSYNQAVIQNEQAIAISLTPVESATATDSATVNVLIPHIDVDPLSLSSTQAPDIVLNQTLNITDIGGAPLIWEIAETQPDRETLPGIVAAPEPVFNVPEAVTSKADCAAFENYPGREPAGWAEFCADGLEVAPAFAPSLPTSNGYAQDVGYVSDNFVRFPLNNFPGQTVMGTSTNAYYGMDFDSTGTTLYALNDTNDTLGTIDLATGAYTPIVACPAAGGAANWTGMAIDPTTDVMYASTAVNLYTLDPATCSPVLVGPFGTTTMIAIAVNAAGAMYGHDITSDSIYTIDTATGAATLVGPTGYAANFAQGMDFDNEDGTLYIWLYVGSGANHYGTVNLATGAVTPLASSSPTGEFEGATQTLGLCIPTDYGWLSVNPTSGTTAPGATTPLTVAFDSTGLAVGTYTGQLCVRSNDPDPGPGNHTALVPVPVTLVVEEAAPSITLAKTVGTEAGVCAATDNITVLAGATVYYCYTVTNNGNVAFNLHDLVDDQLGTIFSGLNYMLAPGASVNTVDAGLTISAVINATTTNVATWTAYNTNGASATATATATVTVTGGQVYGYVFDDLNVDGWRNAGETTGQAGVPVILTQNGVQIDYYWSNAPSGWYDFGILNPGNYCIEIVVPAGYVPTSPTQVCFTLGGTDKNVNFGLDKARANIGDLVFFDANSNGVFDLGDYGIGNVTVALWTVVGGAPGAVIATTTTAADGTYLFANVLPGAYFVQVTDVNGELTDLTLTTAGNPLGPITVVHMQTYLDADFGYNLVCSSTRGAITGRVWNDVNADGVQDAGEAGIAGVTACAEPVSYLSTRCRTTNSAGYFYMCVPRGTYLVAPLTDEEPLASMTPTTPEFYLPVVIRPGGSFTTAFFGYK